MIHSKRLGISLALFVGVISTTASALAETWYVDVNATDPADKVCTGDGVTTCDTCADCPKHCEYYPETICTEASDCPYTTPCMVTEKCVPVETTSWCNSSPSLHDVFAVAFYNDTILVADGTYLPDPTCLDDPRTATLLLPLSNVTIQGGYAGCGAADPDERDPILHETILSGDIGIEDDDSDNCYHVLTAPVNSGLPVFVDGFTITQGNASKTSLPNGVGGGFYTDGGKLTVTNCTFRNNSAYRRGGGLYLKDSTTKFIDSVIRDNTCQSSGGGLCINEGAPTLKNCLITGNTSVTSYGGGLYASVTTTGGAGIYNCTVTENSANASGGGLYFDGGLPLITDCILWGNTSNYGSLESAQIRLDRVAIVTLDYSCIQGCEVLEDGLCEAPTTNIGDDPELHNPRFVPGPMGCYYLSQTLVGEPEDSPCVDAGSDLAANVALYDTFTLADRTTRSDEGLDAGDVDLGYHYPPTELEWMLGDYDGDGLVTLDDYTDFAECFTGAEPADMPPCCRFFDYELDGTVDLFDYAEFQVTLTAE